MILYHLLHPELKQNKGVQVFVKMKTWETLKYFDRVL